MKNKPRETKSMGRLKDILFGMILSFLVIALFSVVLGEVGGRIPEVAKDEVTHLARKGNDQLARIDEIAVLSDSDVKVIGYDSKGNRLPNPEYIQMKDLSESTKLALYENRHMGKFSGHLYLSAMVFVIFILVIVLFAVIATLVED